MMVIKKTKSGSYYREPPYTKAEEAEFYRRVGDGPVTIVRGTPPPPPSQTPPEPPPEEEPQP